MNKIVKVVLVVLLSMTLFGCAAKADVHVYDTEKSDFVIEKLSAKDLVKLHEENEINFRDRYERSRIDLTVKVKSVRALDEFGVDEDAYGTFKNQAPRGSYISGGYVIECDGGWSIVVDPLYDDDFVPSLKAGDKIYVDSCVQFVKDQTVYCWYFGMKDFGHGVKSYRDMTTMEKAK